MANHQFSREKLGASKCRERGSAFQPPDGEIQKLETTSSATPTATKSSGMATATSGT